MFKKMALLFCLSLFVLTFLFIPVISNAQEVCQPTKESPEKIQKEMDATFQQMGPAMVTMMENMMGAMFVVLSKPETADKLATFTKNYYDALIKKGFTKEEALRIVVSVGMPSMGK